MNTNGHIETEDLAMFAMLLLSEEEAAVVREHVRVCALCGEEFKQVRQDLALYALAVEPVEVPAAARERFMARLGEGAGKAGQRAGREGLGAAGLTAEPTAQPRVEGSRGMALEAARQRSAVGRVLPWLGWAAAAAALVAAVGLKQDRDALRGVLALQEVQTARLQSQADEARHILDTLTDPAAVRVNLTVPKAPATPAARATYEPKSGTLLMLASNLAPIDAQKVYELWLIPADGAKPVPAGTFSPDAHGNASLLVPALHGAVAAKAFGITVERAGGSATPSLPILLAGSPT